MKRGKVIEIESFKDYSVKFGSINDGSKTVYLTVSTWGQPKLNQEINYNKTIRDFNKKIKSKIYELLSDDNDLFLKDRTIVDLDIKESGIRFNKKSFLNLEITLFLDTEIFLNSVVLQSKLNHISNYIIKNVFKGNEYFKFTKKKK